MTSRIGTPGKRFVRSFRYARLSLFLFGSLSLFAAHASEKSTETGYVKSDDGVRLYYAKVGSGPQVVIIPGRLFLFRDFRRLAAGRTLIFYDMRNRGLSDPVADPAKISIQGDVSDLDAVRRHFKADKPDLIGFSYLGMMVVYYATQHPDHVGRIVQLGPVSRRFGTKYPKGLTAEDEDKVPDPAESKRLNELYKNGYAAKHPREYCEMEWKVGRFQLVGNPANVGRVPNPCAMPNEWPTHLFPHFQASIGSIQALDLSQSAIAKVTMPVLTIHGTKDRNAPYGGGREWNLLLPDARLITVPGAAHMSWVDSPVLIMQSIDIFLKGKWPGNAQKVTRLALPEGEQGK